MEQGRLLAGRYRLAEILGHGGMSVVWRAEDEVLGREVAVKMLAPALAADPDVLGRIRSEARAAARTCHPHIVNVHDYGEVRQADEPVVPYVVMEIVRGTTLADAVRDGPLTSAAAVRVCAEVAGALTAAHAHGIVHRDVTPGNVMLTDGGAKLVDFGISASTGEADTGPGGLLLGTPAYLAPERLEGRPVQPASDVYALGVLLYKTLTGHLPWQITTTTEVLAAHRYTDPAPLPPVPGLPDAVADLCRRCLAKHPEDRPTSAEAARLLGAAVTTAAPWIGRAPIGSTTEPSLTPTAAWSRATGRLLPSRRRLAATLAAVGMLLAVVLAGSWAPPGGNPAAAFEENPAVLGAGLGARQVECRVRYEVRRDSGTGFAAAVTVTNAAAADLADWELEFAFPADQRVSRLTGARWHQAGNAISISGAGLPAGAAVTLALDGTYRRSNPLPASFLLNDGPCTPELVMAARAPAGDDDDDDDDDDGSNRGKGKKGKDD